MATLNEVLKHGIREATQSPDISKVVEAQFNETERKLLVEAVDKIADAIGSLPPGTNFRVVLSALIFSRVAMEHIMKNMQAPKEST